MIAVVLGAGGGASWAVEPSAEPQILQFDIKPQQLTSALNAFALQSHQQILFTPEITKGKRTQGTHGALTPDAALKQLLAGTGLSSKSVDGMVMVSQADAKGAPTVTEPAGTSRLTPSSSSTDLRLAQSKSGASDVVPGSTESDSADDGGSRAHIPEILVKGSRVFNVDVQRTKDDVQPYYILDSKQIEQSGAVNVEDFLKQRLPMNTAPQSSSQALSARGATSAINLRGLGLTETLVLIDGRRSAGASGSGVIDQPDLNAIPLAAIERIEVLPSSASAIYGGAAMGGVVNVILKKNYEGGQIAYAYENTFSGHAPIDTVSATYGLTLEGGKTRMMLSGQYSDATVLSLRDRPDIAAQGYVGVITRDPARLSNYPSSPLLGATPNIGSSDGHTGLTFKNSGVPLGSPIASIASGASSANPSTIIPGHWNDTQAPTAQPYALLQPFGSAPTTKSLTASIHRDFGSHLELFTEFSTQSNSTDSTYSPISGSFPVPASSPANPFNQSVAVSFPNNTSAPWTTDNVARSATVGMLARLPGDWSSEIDYTWSKDVFSSSYSVRYDAAALSASLAKGIINPFLDTLAYPIDLTSYLVHTSYESPSTLNDLGLRISGSLWSLPGGHPTLTVGLESRREGVSDSNSYDTYTLSPSKNLDTRYFGQSQLTNSIYAEAQVPLVGPSNSITLINSVDLQLAGRSERYTVNARTPYAYIAADGSVLSSSPPQGLHQEIRYTSTNPTIGLKYKPIASLTLRASFAKAFLPPTAQQFLPGQNSGTAPIVDPINGQSYSVSVTRGGNPNLRPQTARDWDFGLILEPQAQALRGLRLNVEYYRIVQLDYITTPSPQEVLANPAYAGRVVRDPTTGRVDSIDLAYLNATQFRTAGWDLSVDYQRSTAVGTFALHAIGTAIDYDKRQYTISGSLLDYAGFPAEGGEAKIKGNATLSWSYREWALAWTTTYFGSYKQSGSPGSPYALQFGVFSVFTDAQGAYSIPSQVYHDIALSYDLGKTPLSHVSGLKVQLDIKNLFNKLPPLDAYYGPYFYSPYGDPRLRDYRVSVVARF